MLSVANLTVLAVNLYVGQYTGNSYGNSSNTVIVAGTNSAGIQATIKLNAGVLQIGAAALASNNLVLIGNGGIITNVGAVTVGGSGGSRNSLVITNGGQLWSTTASLIGSVANSNSVLVVGGGSGGATSLWNPCPNSHHRQQFGNRQVLTVNGAGAAGGVIVTNIGTVYVGYSATGGTRGSFGNSMVINATAVRSSVAAAPLISATRTAALSPPTTR